MPMREKGLKMKFYRNMLHCLCGMFFIFMAIMLFP